jgi:hypothetical protein
MRFTIIDYRAKTPWVNVVTKSINGMVWLEIFTYSTERERGHLFFFQSGNYLPLCLLVEGTLGTGVVNCSLNAI